MPLAAGTRLGTYEVLGLLGAGGMGEVYRARDTRLHREVAIKVLPPERLADEDRRRRFMQEAQAASALNHPNIITIHEIESEGDTDFIVMEYVRGASLDSLIPRAGMRLGEVLRIAIPVAEALATAHARGIVHRDLKPANVVVGTEGAVKVVDFGVAKLLHHVNGPDGSTVLGGNPGLTVPGAIAGTAAYMAPEQATAGDVDQRSDIFSFGALLYEMATGRRAFPGKTTAETLGAVVHLQPTPLSDVGVSVPREFERVVMRCLRKEPERRYQAMRDVSLELQDIKEESDSARPGIAGTSPAPRRRAALPILAGAVLVGIAAFAGWRYWPARVSPHPAPTLVALTSLNGLESHPTFSPDGEQVAFSWNGEDEQNWDIYLKLVGSTEIRRLTNDSAADEQPTWAPDGRQIAFLRNAQDTQGVFLLAPATGTERKLTSLTKGSLHGLTWSPDARWLAAVGTAPGQTNGVYAIAAAGGDWRTISRAPSPEYVIALAWSRDGRHVAFGACTAAVRCQLKVVDVDADLKPLGAVRTLTQPGEEISAITWSRDGLSIIFASDDRLWRIPVDASRTAERLELAGIGAASPDVAAGRDRLAFTLARTTLSIHRLDAALSSPAVLSSSALDFDVQYSPDGERLAFASTRLGDGVQIWTARADGSNARQLIQAAGQVQGSPAWSPDGRQIAFDYRQQNGSWDVYVADAEGGAPRALTSAPGDENLPVWSRDGKWVYYTSDQKEGRNVWRVPSSGGPAQQVTFTGSRYRSAISPEGAEIYFQPSTAGRGSLLTAPAPLLAVSPEGGRVPREVLPCVADFTTTARGIYYVECGGTTMHAVRFIEVTSKRDHVIGQTAFLDTETTSTLAASPDGRTVLVPRLFKTADLMLIENFR